MFIGHFALGFAAKRLAPRAPLVLLFSAAQCADLLWPFLLLAGVEQVRIDPGNTAVTPLDFVSYPYSHSLLMLVVWGLLLGLVARAVTSRRGTAFGVVAALVVSHWVLDWVTHRPDMPVYPGGPKFGLGLWNSVAGTVALEAAMYGAGVWIYLSATRARDGVGRWSLVALAVFLPVVFVANILGGPPPSVGVLEVSAIIGIGMLLAWSWWVDAHREPTRSVDSRSR